MSIRELLFDLNDVLNRIDEELTKDIVINNVSVMEYIQAKAERMINTSKKLSEIKYNKELAEMKAFVRDYWDVCRKHNMIMCSSNNLEPRCKRIETNCELNSNVQGIHKEIEKIYDGTKHQK